MISDDAHAIIDTSGRRLAERSAYYAIVDRYFRGEHPDPPATERWSTHLRKAYEDLRDNLCPLVISALVSRLRVAGFAAQRMRVDADGPGRRGDRTGRLTGDGDQTGDGGRVELERFMAEDIWAYNRMDAKQNEVHAKAATKGDAYVIVWQDPNGRACIYPNAAELIDLEFDPELPDRKLWAVKRWEQAGRIRVNIYYPDRVEKYISTRSAKQLGRTTKPANWEPYQPWALAEVEGEDGTVQVTEVPAEPWPLPNPYGEVPVFHARNEGETGGYGVSELDDIIPLQDALNKELMDLLATSEQYGIPLRYLTGLRPEVDEITGLPKPINFRPAIDAILAIWGEGVSLGQFAVAELAQHVGVINDLRIEIGRLSRTPPHMMFMTTGEIPSGEALKVVESPFTAKVEHRQTSWGNFWEDVMAFAVLVDTTAADPTDDLASLPAQYLVSGDAERIAAVAAARRSEGVRVRYSIEWVDTQPKSPLEVAQTGEAWLRLGIPQRYVWKRLLGMTDRQCDELEALKRKQVAEQLADQARAMAVVGQGQPDDQEPSPNGQQAPGRTPGRTPPSLAPYAGAAARAAGGSSSSKGR